MLYFRYHDGTTGTGKNKKPKFKILDKSDKPVTDKKVLEYIKNLVIPPAYKDVTIFYEKSPKILFEGFDDKGRKQQIYSPEHKKKAMRKKFCHLLDFGEVLPKIEADIKKNMNITKPKKDKIISIIIKIVMICGFRIGNLKYQKLYNSFGISVILKKHVKMMDNTMVISFIGKKGVLNECIIKDKELINEVNKLMDGKDANDYVFKYKVDQSWHVVKAIEINNWLKSYHEHVTSKMFRTFDTNILFIEYMRKNAVDPSKLSETARKKMSNDALKIISYQINNTPTICKKEYLFIDLLSLFLEKPQTFKKYFYKCDCARKCFLNFLKEICK
jgi:DNA topoisomerase-1